MSWMNELPDELKSRKLAIIILTMFVIILLAVLGTILAVFFGADSSLFSSAMAYVTGAGGGGIVAQAVPDTVQASNGTYRAPTVSAPPPAPAPVVSPPPPTPAPVVIGGGTGPKPPPSMFE